MTVSVIGIGTSISAAAINNEQASNYGITRELATMSNYAITREWAERLANAGFDGIHYASRFTTEMEANAWAVFGDAGPDATRQVVDANTYDGHVASREAGFKVLPPPPILSSSVTVTVPHGVRITKRKA
jgi:hypothetical protein